MLFRNRRFGLLVSGQFLSSIGNHLFTLALYWYVLVATGSRGALALVGFAQSLPGVAALFTGVYVDHWRKRRTMLASDALRLLIVLGLVVLLRARLLTLPLLVLGVLGLELVGAFFRPAGLALLPEIVPREELPSASGTLQASASLAQMIGMLGGGAIVAALGVLWAMAANAFSFVVSLVSLLSIRVAEEVQPRKAVRFLEEWLAGIRLMGRSRLILRVVLAALAANFAVAPLEIVMPAWVRGPLHGAAWMLGMAMAAILFGMLLGGTALGAISKRLGTVPLLTGGFVAFGLGATLVGAVPNLLWCVGWLVVAGFAGGVVNGYLTALAMQVVPAPSRGRVFGAMGALTTLAAPLGMAFFGVLMTRIPLPVVLLVMGAVTVAAGCSFLLPLPDDVAAMAETSA